MALAGLGLVVIVLVLAFLVSGIIAQQASRRAGEGAPAGPGAAAIARVTAAWRWAGLALGVVVAVYVLWAATRPGSLGRFALVAPGLGGAAVLLGTTIGELVARPAQTVVRTASVQRRSLASLLPKWRTGLVVVGVLLAAGLLAAGTRTGSPDDMGRAGRAFTQQCTQVINGYPTTLTSVGSPWPGSYYAVPAALALVGCVALALAGIGAMMRRASPSAADAGHDLRLRQEAMRNILSALGVVAFGMIAPVAALMASRLASVQCPIGVDPGAVAIVLALTALTSLVIGLTLLARLMVPRPLPKDPVRRWATVDPASLR